VSFIHSVVPYQSNSKYITSNWSAVNCNKEIQPNKYIQLLFFLLISSAWFLSFLSPCILFPFCSLVIFVLIFILMLSRLSGLKCTPGARPVIYLCRSEHTSETTDLTFLSSSLAPSFAFPVPSYFLQPSYKIHAVHTTFTFTLSIHTPRIDQTMSTITDKTKETWQTKLAKATKQFRLEYIADNLSLNQNKATHSLGNTLKKEKIVSCVSLVVCLLCTSTAFLYSILFLEFNIMSYF